MILITFREERIDQNGCRILSDSVSDFVDIDELPYAELPPHYVIHVDILQGGHDIRVRAEVLGEREFDRVLRRATFTAFSVNAPPTHRGQRRQ